MEIIELQLSEREFRAIRTIVYDTTGINLSDSKRALIVSRLSRRLRQLSFDSFQPYISLLESDTDEVLLMINRITTNLTKFYREDSQFKVLKDTILPSVLENKKRSGDNALRIWSAGCSTGEEVYTILFEISNAFDGRIPATLDMKILGSDIDTNVLKKASSGTYSGEEVTNVKHKTLEIYFDKLSANQYRIKRQWRQYVLFKRINLVYDNFKFKRKVDIIFCRNVVIYFDNHTREKLYNKFHAVLNEPGFFFSGHSENLFKYNKVFKLVEKSIYKKVV
ncbi:MAG: protein-glutamate O-methyltransferase CheR [bacterium]|nr:protein-glutamate O-methyltransferase CheR [bacterium]